MLAQTPALYKDAQRRSYALAAFNIFSRDSALAVLQAAEMEMSPVILQVSMGTRGYVESLDAFVADLLALIRRSPVPVGLHHDHCPSLAACAAAIQAGLPSVMFDGSHLPYEENIAATRAVVEYAHRHGAVVEAELGCLPGFEDQVFSDKAVYTDPLQAKEFVQATGCDSLAVAVGTSHGGVKGDAPLPLDLGRLAEIHAALPGYPLVLHGAASLPEPLIDAVNAQGGQIPVVRNVCEEDIRRSLPYGVVKLNMDVDNFLCFTAAARRHLNESPEIYDPRKYLKQGWLAFQAEVAHKIKQVAASSGMAADEEGQV